MLLCRVQNAFAVSEGRGERVRSVGGDCRAAKLERRSEDAQASAEGKEMSLLPRPAAPGHCRFAQVTSEWCTRPSGAGRRGKGFDGGDGLWLDPDPGRGLQEMHLRSALASSMLLCRRRVRDDDGSGDFQQLIIQGHEGACELKALVCRVGHCEYCLVAVPRVLQLQAARRLSTSLADPYPHKLDVFRVRPVVLDG